MAWWRLDNQWQAAIPSRFIDNLSKKDVEVITPPAIYGGNYGATASTLEMRSTEKPFSSGLQRAEAETTQGSTLYSSPGWQRMNSRPPSFSNSVISNFSPSSGNSMALEIGEKVFHQKFGYGHVKIIEGDTISVQFKKSGDKKVKANFLLSKDSIP